MSLMPEPSRRLNERDNPSLLRIHSFGTFHVIRPEETGTIAIGSRQKAWSLFKYLLVNRGTTVPTSTIMKLFWPERPADGGTAPLRTAISRLKSELEPYRDRYDKSSYLIYRRGACTFNVDAPIWLDAEEFEHMCKRAHVMGRTDHSRAADLYLEALELYRGEFLPEDTDAEWTLVPRESYRRLFYDSVKETVTWLVGLHDYERARFLLERAMQIDPVFQEPHGPLIRLYKELGIVRQSEDKPFEGAPNAEQAARSSTPMIGIEKMLTSGWDGSGAFVCDTEVFRQMLALERRRLVRTGGEASLVVLEAIRTGSEHPDRAALDLLEHVARSSLRRADVVCRLDAHRLGLLCPATGTAGAERMIGRIRESFKQRRTGLQTEIRPSVRSLVPSDVTGRVETIQ